MAALYSVCARRISWRVAILVGAGVLLAARGGPAFAELRHRYTFNDGDASDSVGNADGELLGAASVSGDGMLTLPGGPADYVSLDGPAINLGSYTDATFEAWFKVNQAQTWSRVFDFGDRTVGGQSGYVYYTPTGGGGGGLGVYATSNNRTEAPHGAVSVGQEHHLAFVIDDNANGGVDALRVYLDGALAASVSHDRSLGDVQDTFAFLGESLVNDPNFNGAMDEFRIYDHAFDAAEVESSFAAGPTPLAGLRLEVNTVTGQTEIVAEDSASLNFDYYKVNSPGGALDIAGWQSLDDRGVDAAGAGEGESWEEGPLSDANELIEFYLLGASRAESGDRLDLGAAYNPAVLGAGEPGDLQFQYAREGSSVLQPGQVVYVTSNPLAGDFTGDGRVDAADYTLWRDTLGSTTDLDADASGNGTVDQADYVVWKSSYGAGSQAAAAAVPEPGAWVVLFVGGTLWAGIRRRL